MKYRRYPIIKPQKDENLVALKDLQLPLTFMNAKTVAHGFVQCVLSPDNSYSFLEEHQYERYITTGSRITGVWETRGKLILLHKISSEWKSPKSGEFGYREPSKT